MKLTNNALQELYETIVNGTFSFSPYAECPIDKAFRKCDDRLSESITFEHIKKLENDNDVLRRSNDILLSENADLANKKKKLEKDLDDFKNRLNYCTHSRDNWRARAKYAEDEIEALKKDNKDLEKRLMETTETLEKVNADRNSYHDLYTELKKDYDKLFEENRKLKARTDCLRYEVEWYRKHYKEQSDKTRELKSTLNSIYGRNGVSKNCYDQGQTDLWVALQNVNNSQPFEIATCFPDVTGMEDILNWDLEDFLDAYKKWWEEKEKERLDHMRDYLARFCEGRVCEACPLGSNEYKCGCGYSFKKHADDDWKIIPDEELERYYNKAWHGDADCMSETRKRVKEACDAFAEGLKACLASEVKEVPVSCDIPIKDLSSWECTIEATVEINKDLLEKVCGVKPDDKK